MTLIRLLLALSAVPLLLAGCGAGRSDAPAPGATPRLDAPAAAGSENRIGTLPPQTLKPEQCGLFLWARTVPPRLVFFADAGGASGLMALDGRSVALPRTAADGVAVFDIFERQRFQAGGITVDLTLGFERRGDVVGGALVRRGLLDLKDASGWSYVLPVGGIVGCQPKE